MFYFAYGSNLNKEQMKFRCPDAKVVGSLILPKARLMFRGVADVECHDTDSVAGGVWDISKKDEKALDRYEGVSNGLYRKAYIKISVDGQAADCLIYVMCEEHRRYRYGMPAMGYYEVIADGYKDFGLDDGYLKKALTNTHAEIWPIDKSKLIPAGAMI